MPAEPIHVDPLAALSLLVSGMALGWTMYRDLVDRGKFKVHCYLGKFVKPGMVEWDKRTYLIWSVTNTGSKPLVLAFVGGDRIAAPKLWRLMPPYMGESVPKRLESGDTHMSASRDLSVLQPGLKSLWAQDTFGRVHRVSSKQVQKLIVEAQGLRSAEEPPSGGLSPLG